MFRTHYPLKSSGYGIFCKSKDCIRECKHDYIELFHVKDETDGVRCPFFLPWVTIKTAIQIEGGICNG